MPGPEEGDAASKVISVAAALYSLGIDIPGRGSIHVDKLSGGLTNDNVLVTLVSPAERKLVLRRFLASTSRHLHYNRQQEYDNSRIAAELKKIGAPVIGYVPATAAHGGALAVEYVQGETLDKDQIRAMCSSEEGIARIVSSFRKMHAEPISFTNHFDPFRARVQYEKEVQLLTARGISWEGYDDLVKRMICIQEHLEKSTEELVDCHNDLLGANFLDAGSGLTIIDWELSGRAEPSWELGNFISENGLDGTASDHIVSSLITQYWSDCKPALIEKKIKRARLFSLVSKVTWAAWGAVLHNLDRDDAFDYQDWCMQRLQRAKLLLDDKDTISRLCNG